jgi:hypothetical protein
VIDVMHAFCLMRELDKSIHETQPNSASRSAMYRSASVFSILVESELRRLENLDATRKKERNMRRRKA